MVDLARNHLDSAYVRDFLCIEREQQVPRHILDRWLNRSSP